MTLRAIATLRGGEWLLRSSDPLSVFTPERLSDEQRLIAQTTRDFVRDEVLPSLDQLETKDWALARRLLVRCGDLGLLGADADEASGGLGLDKTTAMLVSEKMSGAASFSATFGSQVNLTVLPLSLFGTDDQKARYLPRLISGEHVGAYCLSESTSGSDALSARARATRQDDGSYVLNGEKMWITNGGFADVFVVFAKVVDPSGDQFTAFIVERTYRGVSTGKEEHKMGLHGSSTTPVLLQDVHVPAANVLGEVGKGHKVAFNVLNFGRFKLGAGCSGGAQVAIGESARYAASRKQFGQPLATFGAIRHKLGSMVARAYAVESLLYRTSGMIDARIAEAVTAGASPSSAALAAFEEHAIEASIAKVACSEALDFILDENVQIHGGNGYVHDYPAERHYRDARVNRIFEGTNEINRLLITGLLAKRAAKGDIGVIPAARALQDELLAPPSLPEPDDAPLATERQAVEAIRKATLLVIGVAMQTYGTRLADEQEALLFAADLLTEAFAAESAVLRAAAAVGSVHPRASLHVDATSLVVAEAALRTEAIAREALASMAEGDMLRAYMAGLRRCLKVAPTNTVVRRRRLADDAVARGGYAF